MTPIILLIMTKLMTENYNIYLGNEKKKHRKHQLYL
jgi:hypothetical protein